MDNEAEDNEYDADDECEIKGCDIPEGVSECRVCGAELVDLEEE